MRHTWVIPGGLTTIFPLPLCSLSIQTQICTFADTGEKTVHLVFGGTRELPIPYQDAVINTHDHLPRFCHHYNTSALSESTLGHTRHCGRVRSDSVYPRHVSGLGAGSLSPTLSSQPLSACVHACVRWWWWGWDAPLASVRGVAAFQHVFFLSVLGNVGSK